MGNSTKAIRVLLAFVLFSVQSSSGGVILIRKAPAASPSGTAFVTTGPASSPSNNFNGCLGMSFTVGGAGISVTQLGRWVVSGNSQSHALYLLNASGARLGTVTVNTSGASVGYLYTSLGSPVALSASTVYYVLTSETGLTDQWYGSEAYSTTAAATVGDSVYVSGACSADPVTGITIAASSQIQGPVNFKYN